MIVTSRFINYLPVREFLRQFVKIMFGELITLNKSTKRKHLDPDDSDNEIFHEINGLRYGEEGQDGVVKVYPPFMRAADDSRIVNARRTMKKAYIVDLVIRILEVRHLGVNADIKERALDSNRINVKLYETQNKALLKIIEFFGDPKDLFNDFMDEYREKKGENEGEGESEENERENHNFSKKEDIRKAILNGRYLSSSSSSSDFMRDEKLSGLSSSKSKFKKDKHVAPSIKKELKQVQSQLNLVKRVETAKKQSRSNRNLPTQKVPIKQNNNLFDIQPLKNSKNNHQSIDDDSSIESSRLPPISKPSLKTPSLKTPSIQKPIKSKVRPKPRSKASPFTSRKSSNSPMSLSALKQKRMFQVKSLAKIPKNRVDRKAFRQLEKMEKRRRKKIIIKEYEDQQKKIRDERERIMLKNELERRKLVLGVSSTNEYMDGFRQLVFDLGDPEVERYERWQQKLQKEVELFDFDEEEYRDKYGVILYIKKYSKLLKFLFKKYANSGHSIRDVSNFDNMKKKAATINVAELTKMLKDHNTGEKDITKREISKFVQLVSTKMMKKDELHSLDAEGFIQFFLQVAHLLYTRPPNDLSHLPPVEHVKELIKRFRYAAKSRGESTIFYEDPDITFITDKDVLRELNWKIIENPNYPLPDGYYKVKEKEMKLYYEIPEYYDISESQKI